MEEVAGGGGGIQWWWGVASAAQMGWGVRSYAKGYAGDSRLMPVKAFAVASLFVGSAASASVLLLQANGIYGVEDLMEAGANLRAKLGLPPRTENKNMDDSWPKAQSCLTQLLGVGNNHKHSRGGGSKG